MDPLYANLDKRNNSADQPQTPPAPQPTAYSMPNFGQPASSSTAPTGPIVSNPSVPTPNATAPTTPIMSTPTRPTTSGTGDIILNVDQPKKKSKGIIAVIISLIVLIAAVICGAIFLLPHNNNSTSEKLAAKTDFNIFMNCILELQCENQTDFNLSLVYNDLFKIGNVPLTEEGKISIDATAVRVASKNFYQKYNSYRGVDNDEDLLKTIWFYSEYATGSIASNEDIIKKYIQEGKESAETSIQEWYEYEKENFPGLEVVSQKNRLDELAIAIIDTANKHGCIKDGSVNEECNFDLSDSESDTVDNYTAEYSEYLTMINNIRQKSHTTINVIFNDLYEVQVKEQKEAAK